MKEVQGLGMLEHVKGLGEVEIPHFDQRPLVFNFVHDALPEHGEVCGGAP